MKKLIILTLSTLLVLSLTGCWDYQALSEKLIVAGIGVDLSEGEYLVTIEAIKLSSDNKSPEYESVVLEARDKSLMEAARRITAESSGKLYFRHCEICVIGEELAGVGVETLIQNIFRSIEFQENLLIVVAKKTTAAELLKRSPPTDGILSLELADIVRSGSFNSAPNIDEVLYNMFNTLRSDYSDTLIPAFSLTDGTVLSDGTALFKQGKLAGYLDPDETKYYLFAMDMMRYGSIPFTDAQGEPLIAVVKSNKTSRSYNLENGVISLNLKINTEVYLESVPKDTKISTVDDLERIERGFEQELSDNIMRVISKLRNEFGADPFEVRSDIANKYRNRWAEIKDNRGEEFKRMEISVTPGVHITDTQLSGRADKKGGK